MVGLKVGLKVGLISLYTHRHGCSRGTLMVMVRLVVVVRR